MRTMVDCQTHVSDNWDDLYPYARSDGTWDTLSKQRALADNNSGAINIIDVAINNGCKLGDAISVSGPNVSTSPDGTATVDGSFVVPQGDSINGTAIVTVDGSRVESRPFTVSGTVPVIFNNVSIGQGTHTVCLEVIDVTPP